MTTITQTCVQLARADAALLHAFNHRHHAVPQIRLDMKRLQSAATEVIETTFFVGQGFAAANDNTMTVGVA